MRTHLLLPLAALAAAAPAPAQEPLPEIRLRLDPARHTVAVRIEIDLSPADTLHLLFRFDWDGYPGIPERIGAVRARGMSGSLEVQIAPDSLGRGHMRVIPQRAERVTVAYNATLEPPHQPQLYHRASQLAPSGGHLVGNDLLPKLGLGTPPANGGLAVRLWLSGLPPDWRVVTAEPRVGNAYHVRRTDGVIFVVGPLRTRRLQVGPRPLTVAIQGRWPVAEERIFAAVERIAGSLHRIAGNGWRRGDHLVAVGRAPLQVIGVATGGQVRGRTGLIYAAGSAPPEIEFAQWLQTTAHELMHWYVPSGFRFGEQPPAWFAEGFNDYLALKSLLAAELIEPRAFLERIGARIARYRANPLYGHRSLPDAEPDFWQEDAYRYIYDGGAAAAFLLDLGFQDRGVSLERVLQRTRGDGPIDLVKLTAALTEVRENEWFRDWLDSGVNPDWQGRLESYGLSLVNGSLQANDDWATDALGSIRP